MSQDDIDRLVGDRRLVHESFDDDQVAGFWSKAASAFADAQVEGLSTDTAFQTAYRACLQATLAVLATYGLRVKSTAGHFTAFYTLQKLGDELRARSPYSLTNCERRAASRCTSRPTMRSWRNSLASRSPRWRRAFRSSASG